MEISAIIQSARGKDQAISKATGNKPCIRKSKWLIYSLEHVWETQAKDYSAKYAAATE